MRFRRRRSTREWADDNFVDDWLAVRNRKAPGRSSQERRRRWVIGMILMSLPLSLVGCLISSAASSSSDEALGAAVRAEAAAGSVELPCGESCGRGACGSMGRGIRDRAGSGGVSRLATRKPRGVRRPRGGR